MITTIEFKSWLGIQLVSFNENATRKKTLQMKATRDKNKSQRMDNITPK